MFFKPFMIDVYSVLWTIHLLYRDQFYWWRKPQYSVKTTDLSNKLDTCYHMNSSRVKPVTLEMKITTLIARVTDYTCRCQSRLFAITATTIPTVPTFWN